ncbi:MAG: hypothetical protein IKD69_04770 [Solobacterium sp.]|nr:hypothetical protein [Solobacterium sp.]
MKSFHVSGLRRHGWKILFSLSVMTMLVSLFFLTAHLAAHGPELVLAADEVILKEGELFQPAQYVAQCSKGELLLPEETLYGEGTYAAVYRLKTRHTEIMRILLVHCQP